MDLSVQSSGKTADALSFHTVQSPALKGRADLTLYCPPELEGRQDVPLVILLHGVYGSHWAWALQGQAHKVLQWLIDEGQVSPYALAMPSDGLYEVGSGYVPHQQANYEHWIAKDVPATIRQLVPQVSEASELFIGGLSMGGYGAFRIGLRHPEFRAVSAHSSMTSLMQMHHFSQADWSEIQKRTEDISVQEMLMSCAKIPPLRFDCGLSDLLLEYNRELHQWMLAQGIEHLYEEFDGGHEWDYWTRHLADTLRFFQSHSAGT